MSSVPCEYVSATVQYKTWLIKRSKAFSSSRLLSSVSALPLPSPEPAEASTISRAIACSVLYVSTSLARPLRYSLFTQPSSLAEKLLSVLSSKLLVWLYTNTNILLLHFLQLLQSAHFNGTPHRNLDLALSIRMNCWQLQVSFKNLKEDGTNRGGLCRLWWRWLW